jgi:hypothetical protein
MIRPSSLPMLAQCPQFESGETSDFANAGTERHEALNHMIRGTVRDAFELPEEDLTGVEWASEYIKLHAPMADFPLRLEQHLNPLDAEFNPVFENGGTADAICGPHLFDFKWRERNYDAQMAAYALALFGEHETVTVHVLFGATRRAQVYKLDEPTASALVTSTIGRAKDPNAQPTPCDYCGWCAKRLTCKPYTRAAKRVAEGYADEPLLAQVKSWHPSEMESADEIALGLTIARKLLAPWCKSMEHHARDAAMKRGLQLPGYELKEKAGKTHVADVARAHELLALPVSDFLKCCELRMNTSKKYPDRTGVIDMFAKVRELKKAPAGREVKQKLSEVITTGKPTMSLVAIGGDDNEEES